MASTHALAAGPTVYCSNADTTEFGQHSASSESLDRVASAAEASLESGEQYKDWESRLTVSDVPDAGIPPETLSRYCLAAGQDAWVTGLGYPAVARAYLQSAYLYAEKANLTAQVAEKAHLAALESRAAYRSSGVFSLNDSAGASGTNGVAESGDFIGVDVDALQNPALRPCTDVFRTPQPVQLLSCAILKAEDAKDWSSASQIALELATRLTNDANGANLISYAAANHSSAAFDTNYQNERKSFDEGARRVALDGLAMAQKIEVPRVRTEFLGRLIEAALNAGQTDLVPLVEYAAMMRSTVDAEPISQAYADAISARIALTSGDSIGASELLKQAIMKEVQQPHPGRLADWYLMMWSAIAKAGKSASKANPGSQADIVRSAYLALQSIRPVMAPHDSLSNESAFALRMQPVFEAAIDVQLPEKDNDVIASDPAVTRAQSVYEEFRQAEIQNDFYGDNCIPPLPPVKLGDLKAGEIILYPILLKDRIELIYAEAGDKEFHQLKSNSQANRAEILALSAELRAALIRDPSGSDDGWKSAARKLYTDLVAPIEAKLKPGSNLAIVPDSAIRTLPFAALLDSDDKYLIERTRLSIAPSLSYVQPGPENTGRIGNVVAADLESSPSLPNGNFRKLDGAYSEALAATNNDADHVLRDFTIERLKAELSGNRIDVLHLATHASFNGGSDRSFIVASNGEISLSDLREMISKNRAKGDVLDLLVLSACETAEGDDEASMGLAGAAIQSGARSALATLWQVDANATVDLMRAFYREYRSGKGKAEALRSAQLSLLDDASSLPDDEAAALAKHPEWKNPYYWAGFTLIGGWR